jgi:hypothetical protein
LRTAGSVIVVVTVDWSKAKSICDASPLGMAVFRMLGINRMKPTTESTLRIRIFLDYSEQL